MYWTASAIQSPGVLKKLGAKYPEVKLEQSLDAVIEDPSTAAVVVATPAETHFGITRRLLEAGKDVFVEKPLVLRCEDAKRLMALAEQKQRILMVGHLLEFHPAITRLQELIESGELGRVEYIYSNRLNLGKVRPEENALWSFAPHDISVILLLLKQLPIQVTATGGAYLQPNIADVTISTMLFDRGVRAHLLSVGFTRARNISSSWSANAAWQSSTMWPKPASSSSMRRRSI